MRLSRRKFLHAAAGAAVVPGVARVVSASDYPTRPVRRQILPPNPSCAAPDGYTLLLAAPANATNVALFAQLNFDFMRDVTPVAGIIRFPDVVDVNLSVPVHTIPELISYAKANPGKLNFASSGIGSTLHVAGELFKMMAGVDIVHVPYRGGGPALVDLMSGRVQLMFDNLPTSLEFIRAGKLRPLAVTTAARSPVVPDLPTVADFVPGYEASEKAAEIRAGLMVTFGGGDRSHESHD
jgi:tripartite-type tricarboxylate transporter receptor subunit TctC